MKRRRRRIMRNGILVMGIVLMGAWSVQAGQARLSSKKIIHPKQADLEASISVSVEKERPEPLVTCFHLHPVFTVRNIGTGVAKNFHVKFVWGAHPYYQGDAPKTWEKWIPSLEPGHQHTWGHNPPMEFVCCVRKNATGHAFLSVLADSHNSIQEKSETNNKAKKHLVLHR